MGISIRPRMSSDLIISVSVQKNAVHNRTVTQNGGCFLIPNNAAHTQTHTINDPKIYAATPPN
jgi:hypothetical protein